MLAPLLYMLALGGIGAAVMFSGYSQILRSNAEMTANNAVRQQLSSASQILSAAATLDPATSTILQPPAIQSLASVSDVSRLPSNAAVVASSGQPNDCGVLDPLTGARQLDPWGKYYIYCRWETATASPASPSLMLISSGPDGLIQTNAGDTTAQGDDRIIRLTVAEAVNRANVWQTSASNQVKYGASANPVVVNADGSIQAASLTLAAPLPVASGGTGAATAVGARVSLNVPDTAGNDAVGVWPIGVAGNSGTTTAFRTPRNVSIAGGTGLGATAIPFDGTSDLSLTLTGTLALSNGGTGATTPADARTKLGLGTLATQNADAVSITGGSISGVQLNVDQICSSAGTNCKSQSALVSSLPKCITGQVLTSADGVHFSCVTTGASSCITPWGGVVAHGSSVTAWSTSGSCGSCASEIRTCINGVLSGGYTNSTCDNNVCAACSLPWGASIPHGSSVTAWNASGSCGSCVSEARTCTDGVLSGSYANSACSNSVCAACQLPWGGTIAHGQSVTAYLSASAGCGATCQSETRTCANGTLSGSANNQSCASACYMNNGPHSSLDCTNAAGTPTSIGGGNYLCQFSRTTCPSGWSQLNKWSSTSSKTGIYTCYYSDGNNGAGSPFPPTAHTCTCSVTGHTWADKAQEVANCVSAPILTVGCY